MKWTVTFPHVRSYVITVTHVLCHCTPLPLRHCATVPLCHCTFAHRLYTHSAADVTNRYCARHEPEILYDTYVSRRYARVEPGLDTNYLSIALDSATSCAMYCSSFCPFSDPALQLDFVPTQSQCDWWVYNNTQYTSPRSSISPIKNFNCYMYQAEANAEWDDLYHHFQPGMVSGQRPTSTGC